MQAGILRLLRELCDDLNLAVLLVTHDFGVLSSVADTIVVMESGLVVETGDREPLITAPQHEYTRSLIESLPGAEISPRRPQRRTTPERPRSRCSNSTTSPASTSSTEAERSVPVSDVSLQLGRSEVLGLVGESGCGKSTLANRICGPRETCRWTHHLRFAPGEATRSGPPAANHLLGIQMVFQNPYASLNPRRRIRDQLTDALALDSDQTWTVDSLLEAVDLPLDAAQRFSHSFSGGQRQRIAIARALAGQPKVLVGDEPIASLDAFLQARIAKMMRDLAIESGASMIFISTTNYFSIVHEIADRVAVMEAGGVVEVGSTEHRSGTIPNIRTQRSC